MKWKLGYITVGVGCGFVTHREVIMEGRRVVAELGYATEFIPGCSETVAGVKREIRLKDVTDRPWPTFTGGEAFPHSVAARRMAGLDGSRVPRGRRPPGVSSLNE